MYRGASAEWCRVKNSSCPICDDLCFENSDHSAAHPVNPPTLIVCHTCGMFRFEYHARPSFKDIRAKQLGYRLSFYLRTTSDKRAPEENDNSLFPLYTYEDLGKIAETRDPSVNEKMQRLLRHLADLSQYPGQGVRFDSTHDYSLLCAKNDKEALFYLSTIREQNLITAVGAMVGGLFLQSPECTLTSLGWQERERMEQSGAESSKAFIAMWFDRGRDRAHDAIQRAIAASGYKPIRLDRVEHVNRIDDEIIAQIRQSKFLVADFTGQSRGVYFEAGFMLGLGRPVIWLCNDQEIKDVHFDTRQYNAINYTDDELDKLRSSLQYRIEAIMGKGPLGAEVSPYRQ